MTAMSDPIPPPEPPRPPAQTGTYTPSQNAFAAASPEVQRLVKAVIEEERRPSQYGVCQNILNHVKEIIA